MRPLKRGMLALGAIAMLGAAQPSLSSAADVVVMRAAAVEGAAEAGVAVLRGRVTTSPDTRKDDEPAPERRFAGLRSFGGDFAWFVDEARNRIGACEVRGNGRVRDFEILCRSQSFLGDRGL